jgi:hypothetical protein
MTWEDDALAGYEDWRARKNLETALSVQRNSLLESRHTHEWMELRTKVLTQFHLMNQRANREITKSLTQNIHELKVRREDGTVLNGAYVPATRTATFSCDAPPFGEQSYGLTVRTIEGNDALVWQKIDKNRDIVDKADIVKEIITSFFYAGSLL